MTALRCLLITLLLATGAPAAADLRPGQPAPDFTLRGNSGANLKLKEQRGKVVLINFWATWCGPCRQEMPLLDALYKRYRDAGFVLLGVNVDDSPDKARTMARGLGVSFPVLFDANKAVSRSYQVSGMPTTVIVDRDGKVRYLHRGYRPGYERKYQEQVRGLLKE
jgi:peroxiredoxin